MKLGICTIQRNRGPWLVEWFAFHRLIGFQKFYFFAHKCTDNTLGVLNHLQNKLDLKAFVLSDDLERPQLQAFQHAYSNYGDEVDWMAFIDGDEFLFPTSCDDIAYALNEIDDGLTSAFGIYWSCFGSSSFVLEPPGLIVENYRRRAADEFPENSHIKSIVRGGLGSGVRVGFNSHIFSTPQGTIDELSRPLIEGRTKNLASWKHLRINHYVCQSLNFFKLFKQMSGSADAGANSVRSEAWWDHHDRNEIYDNSLERFYPDLRKTVKFLSE